MNIYTYHLRVVLGTDVDGEPILACLIRRSWDTKQEAIRFATKFLSNWDVRLVTITEEGE